MSSYKLWGTTDDGSIEFESLTPETLDGALEVIRKDFFSDESVSRSVDVISHPDAADELVRLCLEVAKDGVSVVAIDVANANVVGVAFNKLQIPTKNNEKSFNEKFSSSCKYESSAALINFMIAVDEKFDVFEHYNVDCILDFMFLATATEFRRRRIGELLLAASLEIAKEARTLVQVAPSLCSIRATSIYALKICAKLGFDRLAKINYEDCEFGGRKYSERTGVHESCVVLAKRIT